MGSGLGTPSLAAADSVTAVAICRTNLSTYFEHWRIGTLTNRQNDTKHGYLKAGEFLIRHQR
jgi:hypothetical protein